mgnify:CR=1 FL=1
MGEWQDIASAPHLVSPSIIVWDGDRVCTAWWSSSDYGWVPDDQPDHISGVVNPTHWMPLPSPPSTGETP